MLKDIHSLQGQILTKLLFSPKLRYAQLRPNEEIENNSLNFHLKQLKDLNLIEKSKIYYSLTHKGKEYAGRLNTTSLKITRQAKISAWICCTREIDNETEFLIYTRLKQPFFGCQGFMSGKVDYGENVIDTAIRELKEETGLEGFPKITAIKHYKVFDKRTKELLEDKFMFLCLVKDPKGKLKQSKEGKYEWVKEKDIDKYVTNHFESLKSFKKQIKLIKDFKKGIQFIEEDHFSEKF